MHDNQSISGEDWAPALVREALANNLSADANSIGSDTKLHELPGADSVRLLQVIAELERRLGVEFDDEEIFRPHTFDGLVAVVRARTLEVDAHA